MPSQRAPASRRSTFEFHPYYSQLLFASIFSKFVAFGIVLDIKLRQLRHSSNDPKYAARPDGHWNLQLLLPELSLMSYFIIMVAAYIISFVLIEVSWRVDRLTDFIWRSHIARAWLAKVIGLSWRLAIPITLTFVVAQVIAITNGLHGDHLFRLSVLTLVFARFIWPIQRSIMTLRDDCVRAVGAVSLSVARSHSTGSSLTQVYDGDSDSFQRLADAFPVAKRRHIPTDDVCPICFTSFEEVSCAVVRTYCGHFYCKDWYVLCCVCASTAVLLTIHLDYSIAKWVIESVSCTP